MHPATSQASATRIWAFAAGAVLLISLGALTGCGQEPPSPTAPQQESPGSPATPEKPTGPEPPVLIPDGTAADNLPFFTEIIRGYSEGTEPIHGRPIVDTLVAAGFDRTAMQVSFDRSKTNLVADSIYVSVRWGESCLIGQFASADRSFRVDMPPTVGPDRSLCLIGETRPIDW